MAAPARMRDMIGAAAEAAIVPCIHHVKHQRRMSADGRLQAFGRLPRAITDAGDKFAVRAGGMQAARDGRQR